MQFSFRVLGVREKLRPKLRGQVFLCPGAWDDYSFKTSCDVVLLNSDGNAIDLGTVKIGYKGQSSGWTRDKLPQEFEALPAEYFSLGQDVKYYMKAYELLDIDARNSLLNALRDVGRSRTLNPALQTFDAWLAHNKERIPLE